jgi:hypothetical protein
MMRHYLKLTVAAASLMGIAAMSAASADPLSTPALAGPLAANASPYSVDLPDWFGDAAGKVYVTGAVTGLAYGETNPTHATPGDASTNVDVSNAQVFLQKTDGWLQFYAQFGLYSLPTVGVPYTKASVATSGNFGYLPVGYVKLQGEGGWADWSFEAGKLPTLIGDEYTFTFQNMNVDRGLLWNLEPAVSRGIQVNYASGPLSVSVSFNDGTYSNEFGSLTGLVSYAFNGGADTLAFAGGGNLGSNFHVSALNSSSYYNLIYTHTSGPWTISPYIQYIDLPKFTLSPKDTSVWGGAVLVSYSFDDNWKLAGRVEYETSSGNPATTYNLIGYGAGSNAWSFTITPTYQWKQWFIRPEASYITAGDVAPGDGFAWNGAQTDQFRFALETGILF